jgi:hypothetical protein
MLSATNGQAQDCFYFGLQSAWLATLLRSIVDDAKLSTNPQSCVEFLDIVAITTELLDQANLFSVIDCAASERNQFQITEFVDRIQALQHTTGCIGEIADTTGRTTHRRKACDEVEHLKDSSLKRRKITDGGHHALRRERW